MSGMMGGQPAGNTSTTTTNTPWGGQQPYLQAGFGDAYNWLTGGNGFTGGAAPLSASSGLNSSAFPSFMNPIGSQNFSGPMAQAPASAAMTAPAGAAPTGPSSQYGAPFNPNEIAAQNSIVGMANSGANGIVPNSQSSINSFLNGSMLHSNPYLDKMANAADNSIVRNYQNAVAPGIDSSMEKYGRYGSGALLNGQSQAQQDLATQLGNTNAGIYGNAYQQGMNNMLQANALAPQTVNLGMDLANAQNSVGQAQRNLPLQRLQQYMGLIQGNYGGSSTQSQPYFTNPMGNLAGLAMTAASLYSMSDRRAKEDIHRVGTTEGGLPVYTFRYKGLPTIHMGVMADEVRKVHPEAVMRAPDGYDRVDYGRIS